MQQLIKKLLRKLGLEITRYVQGPHGREPVCLKPRSDSKGTVLISYIVDPFLLKPGEPVSNAHTHDWESLQIAKTFLELGFAVDVVDYRNSYFVPGKPYSFFVGARTNFQRLAQLLNEDCVKIVHLDTAHWIFNNSAAYKRLLDLQLRKSITLPVQSVRQVESNLAIEHADYSTLLGNQFTIGTYLYAGKHIFPIPISTCGLYPRPEEKDFEKCRKTFLWFGSGGFVHKGLDLVLDVFSGMPDFHLYVCGPLEEEEDFVRSYHRELYETPNIHAIGWVDVNGPQFMEIMNQCVGLVYPSASEGQCGSVVNCLHGGLIPIVSYESGVDVEDFGAILRDCSHISIKESVEMISRLPAERLKEMSLKAWNFARTRHSRERFAKEFRTAIDMIMSLRSKEA